MPSLNLTAAPPPHHNPFDPDQPWGPKRDPLYIVVPITVVYVVIFITGVAGNVSTCIVIFRNKSMHTATNYYLFSLAISDLLLLVSGLPQEIYLVWSKYPYVFGEAFCVLQGFAAETSANATVLTITAFTVERYVAICHPFLSHTMSKLSRAVKFIVAIWVVAMCLATPQAMGVGIDYLRLEDGTVMSEYYVCRVIRDVIPHAFEISTFVFFVAPMTLISILYVLIGLQLHRSTAGATRGGSVKLKHRVHKHVVTYTNSSKQTVLLVNGVRNGRLPTAEVEEDGRKNYSRNAQATKHVVKMLVAVVVAFFICWAPFHAQRLLAIYGENTSTRMITAYNVLTYISGVFYYVSTTINPLLYHIISNKFREAFKETFRHFLSGGRGAGPGGRCYSTLSGRSSQQNSHSNTDSCSRQSSLRYLEAEMARLRDHRRPLVVSFKRRKPQADQRGEKRQHRRQEAVDRVREEVEWRKNEEEEDGNGLRPTHVCPLGEAFPLLCHRQEARPRTLRGASEARSDSKTSAGGINTITKSSTMPQIRHDPLSRKLAMQNYASKLEWSLSERNVCDSQETDRPNERSGSLSTINNLKDQNYLRAV